MDISVVIATHNQKERLRLVLCGLRNQTCSAPFEVIVMDDGCTDGTAEMLDELDRQMPLTVIHLKPSQGRCQARNRGVSVALGQVVVFLDGDALPHPEWLQNHWETFEQHGPDCLLCGAEWSLPDLEYFQDPQIGTLMEGAVPSVVREYLRLYRGEMVVTEEMVCRDFEHLHRQAKEGGYPFPELKKVQDQTIDLFTQYPDSPIGWIGFYPHNGLVPKKWFTEVGGFDPKILFSEGWELAYHLQKTGIRPHFVPEARTYHLYHYHDFSDPTRSHAETLKRRRALEYMVQKHQDPKLMLLHFWHAGIWPDPFLPEEMVLGDLIELHRAYQELTVPELVDWQSVLNRHPIWGQETGEAVQGIGVAP